MYTWFFTLLAKALNAWDRFCERFRLFGHWAPRVGEKVWTCYNVIEQVTSVDIKTGYAYTPNRKCLYRHCMSPVKED